MIRLMFPILLFTLATDAWAKCDSDMNVADLTSCLYAEYERAENRLDAIWQSMEISRMSRDEQRAWATYRDATCANEMAEGGQDASVRHAACLLKITEDRIKQLEQQRK